MRTGDRDGSLRSLGLKLRSLRVEQGLTLRLYSNGAMAQPREPRIPQKKTHQGRRCPRRNSRDFWFLGLVAPRRY